MKPRPAITLGVLTLLASVVVLVLPLWFERQAPGSRALDALRVQVEAVREREALDDAAMASGQARSIAAQPVPAPVVAVAHGGTTFPAVISGTVVVAGGRLGDGVGTRVRCTPSLGQVVDGIVDATDRFELRGVPGGRARLSCKRDGLWALDTDLFVDDSEPMTNVSITMHPVRTLHVWVDDAAGRMIECNEANFPLLERLRVFVSPDPERAGEEVPASRNARGTISQETSRAMRILQYQSGDKPPSGSEREPLFTFELTEVPGAHLTLALSGLVVDSIPLPANGDGAHLRFDPQLLAGRLAELEVLVLREGTGSPVPDAHVRLLRDQQSQPWIRARTNAHGVALVPFLARGTYRLHVNDRESIPVERRVEIEHEVGTVRTEVQLVLGVSIAGHIDWGPGAESRPLHVVRCTPVEDGSFPYIVTSRTVPTADRFDFPGLEPGVYRIAMRVGPDGNRDVSIEVDARHASVRDVVLKAY